MLTRIEINPQDVDKIDKELRRKGFYPTWSHHLVIPDHMYEEMSQIVYNLSTNTKE